MTNSGGVAASSVALAHDYLTQRGGAERVVLDIARAFPGAEIHTSLFDPAGTFPEFGDLQVKTSAINRFGVLRRHHRLALPLLALAVSHMRIDADVTIASSSGWAHGMKTTGKKIVYCHAPARWLYQTADYVGAERPQGLGARTRREAATAAVAVLGAPLRHWDRAAAAGADRYLANSTVTQRAVRAAYGIEAEIVPPPPAISPAGPEQAIVGIEPGFVLCVARLLPYKHVDVLIEAVRRLPQLTLVVVGGGPDGARLASLAGDQTGQLGNGGTRHGRTVFAGRVSDGELRWLYRSCALLAAASIEDYGLTPLEAAAFGKPTAALAAGGYLDTIIDGRTGTMFHSLDPDVVSAALLHCLESSWSTADLINHAESFGPGIFREKLQAIVSEELGT